ncbi:MAG: UDP-N-acetylglucosamine--N-acetylmuramyl-(pentapeptide) pyrophosphoryl-undecaprenol N-acetylglucosamine transferase [bacterium]|nr:UDP-N-acetylglucosamine--N-acetylmuramyl-(pentapeptide) pyrophosphoryl-undecaprenol N-acetylglucosamine transferase [bacterium]
MKNEKKYKILLTGGGTGGSVAPLLAVAEELKIPLTLRLGEPSARRAFVKGGNNPPAPLYKGGNAGFEFFWLGTKFGPEREMVERAGIKFKAISGGKWRRYFSLKNLADIFKIKLGFWQALRLMLAWRPNLVISAGSFVSVPVVWAAWLLGVPVLIHQQDIVPGLANRLMAPFAKTITVAFEKSLADYGKKAVWIGNPTRRSLERVTRNAQRTTQFEFDKKFPIVLILGGGTGAESINKLVEKNLSELTKFCRILHITGKDKAVTRYALRVTRYESYEFLSAEQMAAAMKAADLVVTRAGMSTLGELSDLGKASIIIPMPDSHQEANADFFRSKKAAIVARQKYLTPENFTHLVEDSLADKENLTKLSANMASAMKKEAREEMGKIIRDILNLKGSGFPPARE